MTDHKDRKNIARKTVAVAYTITMPREVPEDWDDDMVEFYLNESSRCADHFIADLAEYCETLKAKGGCLCDSHVAESDAGMMSVILMDLSEHPVAPSGPMMLPDLPPEIHAPYLHHESRPVVTKEQAEKLGARVVSYKTAVFQRTAEILDGHVVYRRVA